jgi:hypothetical protein
MRHLPGFFVSPGPLRVACLLLLALGCASQKDVARDQIGELQKLALTDAQMGRSAVARKRLLAAIRAAKDAELDEDDPVAVRSNMALGALYANAFRDERRALAYMFQGVSQDPEAKLPNVMAGPRARKVLAQARANAAKAAKAAKAAEEKAAKKAVAKAPPAPARPAVRPPPPVRLAAAPIRADVRTSRNRLPARRGRAGRGAGSFRPGADPKVTLIEEPPPPPAPPPASPVPRRASPAAPPPRAVASAPERRPPPPPPPPEPEPMRPVPLEPEPEPGRVPVPVDAPVPAEKPVQVAMATPAAAAKPATLPPPRFPAGQAEPIYCPLPIEAPPKHEVVVRCAVRPDLRPGRLTLHYRPSGSETFTTVAMPRGRNGTFQGVVPIAATEGKSLQFFIEAGGPEKIKSGSADSPNVLVLREGATPVGQRPAADEAPADEKPAEGDEADATVAERIRREDDDPLAAAELRRELSMVRRRPAGKLFFGFGFGSGYGVQPGAQLEFRQNKKVDAGILKGGLVHLLPEIGYQLTNNLSLSLQTRFQYAPVEGSGDPLPGTPPETATAFLLRGAYNIGDGPFHSFLSLAAGYGKGGAFRLIVPADPGAERPRSDTIRSGPIVVGGGAGVAYHFSRRIAWPLEVRTLIGFPDLAAVLEVGTGVAFSF